MIRLALDRYEGRMTMVARKLGIGRSTLYRKLKDLGISEPGPASPRNSRFRPVKSFLPE